jgi:hypothetical protein
MTDIPVQVPAPVTEVPLGEASAALPPALSPTVEDVGNPNLLTNPVPYSAPVVNTVDEATPADWHPTDPVARGVSAAHVAVYADNQPGGLADASQHWATFSKMADNGMIPEVGDTAETARLWRKFRTNPNSMKPEESAALLNAVSQIGQATAQSPDLQFDPVGRVASVGAGGEVRVVYPATTHVSDLSLQPLAPPAVDRLRTLAQIGADASRDVPIQDILAPYLGIDTHQSTKDIAKLEEVVAGLAEELRSTPDQIRARVAAGWEKLKTPTRPWEKPFTVGANNPAVDALNDGLSRNLIDAMKGGVNAVDFTTQGDPAVSVQPEGGLAVSAPPTERNMRLLRHLYPAFTKNGVTAWLPGEPARTESAAKLSGEVYNDFFLRAQGGHPLFRPGVSIAYDATDAKNPGEDLGPVVSTQPALKMDRLRVGDIDPGRFDELVQTHAWAIIQGGNSTKAGLIRSGFHPISHKVGDTTQFVVFGITAEQARQHSTSEIVTNSGTYSEDGFRPGAGVSFDRAADGLSSTSRLTGGDVHWFLDGVDREAPPEDAPGEETTQVRSRRRLVTVSGDIQSVIADLEGRGGNNLRVYAHQNHLDGFETAWEHVYTDGTNTTSILTKKPTNAAHAGPVLVRSAEGLPDSFIPPATTRPGSAGYTINGINVAAEKVTDLDGDIRFDGTSITPAMPGTGDAVVSGGRIVVGDPTPAAARLVAAARVLNVAESAILGASTPSPARSPVASAVTIAGDRVQPIKQTRPDSSWAIRFGIVFDPAWRDNAGIKELDPKLSQHLANVYEAFLSQHQAAVELWDLQRIAVTSAYSKTPAYTEWGKLGGSIGLSAKHWRDPALLMNQVIQLQDSGTIVSNVTPTPAYFVAHELGHVAHGALQFGTDGSGARKEILAIRKHLGRDGIIRGLSAQAWHSPEEMVAEAVAESVLASNPRPLAREIVNTLTSAYSRVENARTRRDW